MTLSPKALAKGHLQYDSFISSTNALAYLTRAICLKDDPLPICDTAAKFIKEDKKRLNLAPAGFLATRLRKEASKIFITVTDDNARGIKEEEITNLFTDKAIEFATFYSFHALDKSDCETSNNGTEYQLLVQKTGGASFDICLEDWSSTFSELTNSIKTIVQSQFKLKKNPLSIDQVLVDEVPLDEESYSLSSQGLISIDPEALKGKKEVSIFYQEVLESTL